jgi:hypothetical protein
MECGLLLGAGTRRKVILRKGGGGGSHRVSLHTYPLDAAARAAEVNCYDDRIWRLTCPQDRASFVELPTTQIQWVGRRYAHPATAATLHMSVTRPSRGQVGPCLPRSFRCSRWAASARQRQSRLAETLCARAAVVSRLRSHELLN